jgi:hypothetical protein
MQGLPRLGSLLDAPEQGLATLAGEVALNGLNVKAERVGFCAAVIEDRELTYTPVHCPIRHARP